MAVPSASPLFLRETEIRRGAELLFFGYAHLYKQTDQCLARQGMGRAHHRALYFIARQPDQTISTLLRTLGITKQSLGRVLTELQARELIDVRTGVRDRRQRLLSLSKSGEQLETELFGLLRERMSAAYANAGQEAVTGFWKVLEGLIPEQERPRVFALQRGD